MTTERKTSRLTILLITMAACLIYAIGGGIRSNYGIMMGDIIENSGLSYDLVSFVVAVAQLMFGVMQPMLKTAFTTKSYYLLIFAFSPLAFTWRSLKHICFQI